MGFIAELFYWIALECTLVPNKVSAYCMCVCVFSVCAQLADRMYMYINIREQCCECCSLHNRPRSVWWSSIRAERPSSPGTLRWMFAPSLLHVALIKPLHCGQAPLTPPCNTHTPRKHTHSHSFAHTQSHVLHILCMRHGHVNPLF